MRRVLSANRRWLLAALVSVTLATTGHAQFDIEDFDETEPGPWSDIAATSLTIPMVADGSITIDGATSPAEYGSFAGVNVTPGENAWILAFATDKEWEGPDDSSFTWFMAHDSEWIYIGVDAKDDAVVSNDPNPQFWKDDAIEIIFDPDNTRVNVNTDQIDQPLNDFGGHNYFNYEGRFSRWDEDGEVALPGWANAVDWEYGPEGQVFGEGDEKDGGWGMELRFHKSQFENEDTGTKMVEGHTFGFNIGMDDDDGADLAIQYWWANRARPLDFTPEGYEDGETIADFLPEDDTWVIDAGGRLTFGATGEITLGPMAGPVGDLDGSGALDAGDLDVLAQYMIDRNAAGDFDGDGDTDMDDRVTWVHDIQGSWLGDSNFDGEFNSGDFVAVFTTGKYETGEAAGYAEGDWNGDQEFTSGDFVAAFSDGGYELGPRAATAAVPEPSSILLLLTAAVFASFTRRKRVLDNA